MRGLACHLLMVVTLGAVAAGCGSVSAKPDAGSGSGSGSDADAMPDAAPGCTASSFSCGADDALYQCDADGTALTKVQDCQYGCSVDHCKECAADTTFCSSDDLVMCSADGEIVNPMTCAHGCQMDRCNTCDPSVAYCDGTKAITCGADGSPAATMECGSAGCAGGVCNQCQPNTTSCNGDTLVVCNASGNVQSTTACALGCGTTPNAHCKALVPSYGVSAPTGTLPDLVVDADATLNISNCSASPSSVDLTVGSTTTSIVGAPQVLKVTQTGAPPICIVRFKTITITSGVTLTVINDSALGHGLSLQATGDVQVNGTITFTSNAPGPSPGGTVATIGTNADSKDTAPGGGGGGAARAGGAGGACIDCLSTNDFAGGNGGAADTTIMTRLTGGSAGGNVTKNGTVIASGGSGGGALQLVLLTKVTLGATGRVALNGLGGFGAGTFKFGNLPSGGGGAGGTLVVEAPALSISAGALLAANGGGGAGGCYSCSYNPPITLCSHAIGQPGQLSATRAAGGDCPGYGDGGYEANGDTAPSINGGNSDSGAATAGGAGGGGSSGFIILRGRSAGSVTIAGGATVSPMPTISAVTAN